MFCSPSLQFSKREDWLRDKKFKGTGSYYKQFLIRKHAFYRERQRETKRTFSENKKFKRKEARKKEERKVTEIDKAIEDMRKVE